MKYCFHCMEKLADQTVCPHCGNDTGKKQEIPYALLPGSVLNGKYLIGKVLGQGGFGITYIGMDLALEVKVAIKEYYVVGSASREAAKSQVIYWMNDPGNMDHFLTEARRMAMLEYMPEIAHVRDVFYTNNTTYISMEYVKGEDLKHHLMKNGPISYEQAVKLMLPVVRALGRVHEKGLIHRDISPDNLMMEPRGTLRVLDLGAAGDLKQNNGCASQLIARRGFSPYEQYIEGGQIGPWTDVYAVCATICYCCSGKVIPDAFSRVDRFMQTRNSELEMDPAIPSAGAEVLQQGLALREADRIRSMEELAKLLEESLGNRQKRRETKKKEKKRNLGKWIAAVAVLAAVIAAAVYVLPGMELQRPELQAPEVTQAISSVPETEVSIATEETEPVIDTTEAPVVVLKIAESMELEEVDLGHTEEVNVLSGPSAEDITWSSSNSKVAEISQSGVLSALGFGTTTVTAEYGDQKVFCAVTVTLKGTVDCHYQSNLTGWTITGYRGVLSGDVVLPKYIEGKPVTEIAMEVFSRCYNLNSMVIPDSIMIIPEGLFAGCRGLTSVTIPDSVTEIRRNAFKDCYGLTRIVLPESLEEIKEGAFAGCSGLIRLSIPDSVTAIGKSVFEGCTGLDSVTTGEGLRDIGDNAFKDCTTLTSVDFGSSVSTIGKYAFSGCGALAEIVFPEKLSSIRAFAFEYCHSLVDIYIPESVDEIGWYAFGSCYRLRSISVRKGSNYSETSFPNNCELKLYD